LCCQKATRSAIQQAAAIMTSLGMAKVVLVGDGASICSHADAYGVSLDGIDVVDVKTSPKLAEYAALILEKRKAKRSDGRSGCSDGT